ncbi:MAG: hypothetical protein HYY26_04785 [Acidobacteria bacterium]|nr:hypothetical protein [Acidobacteriota bacterium]
MRTRIALLVLAALCGALAGETQSAAERRMPLTPPSGVESLAAAELEIRVGRQAAEILRLYQPEERPLRVALLVDESVGTALLENLPYLREFIAGLPEGTQILVAYLKPGMMEVAQEFTADRAAAVAALRVPDVSTGVTKLGDRVAELLARFPGSPTAREQIIYIGEGSDPEPSIYADSPLNRAIEQAERRGVAVWALHIGAGEGAAHLDVEAYLERLCTETGGRAFGLGVHQPTLDPYLRELRGLLERQYQVELALPRDAKTGAPAAGKLSVKVRGRKVSWLYPQRLHS